MSSIEHIQVRGCPVLVRYADDYVAMCHSREQAEQQADSTAPRRGGRAGPVVGAPNPRRPGRTAPASGPRMARRAGLAVRADRLRRGLIRRSSVSPRTCGPRVRALEELHRLASIDVYRTGERGTGTVLVVVLNVQLVAELRLMMIIVRRSAEIRMEIVRSARATRAGRVRLGRTAVFLVACYGRR
jgi:hypothetical protein